MKHPFDPDRALELPSLRDLARQAASVLWALAGALLTAMLLFAAREDVFGSKVTLSAFGGWAGFWLAFVAPAVLLLQTARIWSAESSQKMRRARVGVNLDWAMISMAAGAACAGGVVQGSVEASGTALDLWQRTAVTLAAFGPTAVVYEILRRRLGLPLRET
jgi:hypothetical protein